VSNVVSIAGANAAAEPEGFPPPKHFKKAAQKEAWNDLVEQTDKALHVKQQRFTFELAAMLLAKMRAGKSMTATESKELKRQMIALGLAKDDDAGGRGKKRSGNDAYFDD
jgi:hypothetical protein